MILRSGYKPDSQDSRFGCHAANVVNIRTQHRITTFCGVRKCGSVSAW